MKRLAAWSFLLVLLSCSSVPAPKLEKDVVRYVIEPTTYQDKPALKFTVDFFGRDEGRTWLELPSWWASEANYYKDLKELKVLTAGVTMTNGPQPFLKVLQHPPGQRLEMSYILTAQKPAGPQAFRAVITPEYFQFFGHNAFVYPREAKDQPRRFDLIWKNFPASFVLANSFSAEDKEQALKTRASSLKQAVYVGGDYRLKRTEVRGKPLVVAIKGTWKFSDEEFYTATAKVIENERAFWHDDDFPYYFVALAPDPFNTKGSAGGTGLTNSFVMNITGEFTLQNKIIPLLAHEFFHTWNGNKIQGPEPEALYYWFSEGFTDYYSRLLNLRAGLIPLADYVKDVNEQIFFYYTSPVRSAANSRIEKDFWKNADVGMLPYYRGDFLAMNWDTKIKNDTKGSQSLDGFMKSLLAKAQKRGPAVDNATIVAMLSKDIPSVQGDLRAYIQQGNMITPDEKALGPCVKRGFISIGKFDHGFDREKTYASGIVTGLKNGTPAHKAGLREGMKLLDRDMVNPPFTESRMKVMDHGSERWISFLPLGRKKYLMPHFVLDEKMFQKDPDKCLAWFREGANN